MDGFERLQRLANGGTRTSRRTFLKGAALVSVSIPLSTGLLAACGDEDDDEVAAVDDPATDPDADDDEPIEEPEDDQVEPEEDPDVLSFVISQRAEPEHVDTRTAYFTPAYTVSQRIHEWLIFYDTTTDGLDPYLATSWEVIDDVTYEFELREGVKFHDGEEFTAEDVEFTYMRPWMDPDLVDVESVEILDDYRVRIVTKVPEAYTLVQNVAHNRRILPKHLLDGVPEDDLWEHPVGTGPFEFVEWIHGEHVRLKAFDDYWDGRPQIDELIIRAVPEASTRLVELETGAVDLILDVPHDDVPRLQDDETIEVIQSPGLGYEYLAMNLAHPILEDRTVRHAVAYAIDKDALLELFPGTAERTYGPLSNHSWAVETDVERYEYDPEHARSLLEDAGFGDGFSVELKTTTPYREMAEAVQNDLREVSIDMEINVLEEGTFLDDIRGGAAEMYLFGWVDLVDPDHIYWVFHSERQGGERFNYHNERVDELLDLGKTIIDREERFPIYSEAQKLIVEDAPFVFLLTQETLRAYRRDRWEGFREMPLPTGVLHFLKEVSPVQ